MTSPSSFVAVFLPICLFLFSSCKDQDTKPPIKRPNVLILHADQWRAQSFGYTGNPDVLTPNLDQLAAESANFTKAVSGMPVCCPHRASLMTGQRPLTHGVFMNDVQLDTNAYCLAEAFADVGYHTGYIGKWHLDGRGRSSFTPPGARRQGFQYWKALECSHNYNKSAYYEGNDPEIKYWDGYDAIAQTKDAAQYIRDHAKEDQPFLLFLAWGTPHAPYRTAPDNYKAMYHPDSLYLRPNVNLEWEERIRNDLAGYYAHCTAIDDMIQMLRQTLAETGISDNTVILFTSDHGDLIGSHSAYKKQQPYEESIRVPMLIHAPNSKAGLREAPMNSEDVMPTLLGLCEIPIPDPVEGIDYSDYVKGGINPGDSVTLISCIQPFGQWSRLRFGGREYRGIVTPRYTYTRDLEGPWLLFDQQEDPFQLNNLINKTEAATIQNHLEQLLSQKLKETKDNFLSGLEYVAQYSYPPLDKTETVPYSK